MNEWHFVHIPKTAGTAFVKTYGRASSVVSTSHKHNLASRYSTPCKVAIIRNPWDRAVSICAYHFRDQTKSLPHSALSSEFFRSWVADGCQVRGTLGIPDSSLTIAAPQARWLDVDDLCLLRFERLQEDAAAFISRMGRTPKEMSRFNVSRRGAWHDYYDEQTFESISNLYREDVKLYAKLIGGHSEDMEGQPRAIVGD